MEKYLVGGCVRDTLLGRDAQDRDWVVVGSTEAEMFAAGFSRVGESFPVFLHPETSEEHALARTERKNGVGYKGFDTFFDTSVTLKEDLARRDLTINAVAANEDMTQFFDPFGGIKDMFNGVLRHTSDAFADDPLRVVRLARFYARYTKFTMAPETVEMARKVAASGEMNHITDERYWEEMVKVFADSAHGASTERFFNALSNLDVLEHVKYFSWLKKRGSRTSRSANNVAADLTAKFGTDVSLAAFFALNDVEFLPAKCTNTAAAVTAGLVTLFDAQFTGDAVKFFNFFRLTASFHQRSKLFDTVLAAVEVIDFDTETTEVLSEMFDSVSKVNAEMFPNFQGKELGEAINKERTDRLLKVLAKRAS